MIINYFQEPPFKTDSSGIRTLTEASYGAGYTLMNAERVKLHLHQIFSEPTKRKGNGLESLKGQYKSYKESYVKQLQFDPEESNPGKTIFLVGKGVTL